MRIYRSLLKEKA